jgi:hypothetical protein
MISYRVLKYSFPTCLCVFNAYCIHRDAGENNLIDVDLKLARDVFKKLTTEKWISSLVTATIYFIYLGYHTITLLCRNKYNSSIVLVGGG